MRKPNFNNIHFNTTTLLLLIFSLNLSCSNLARRNHIAVEQYLGIKLPQDAQVIHYEKVNPSSEIALPYYVYIQMEMPEDSYTDIAQQLSLDLHLEAEGPILFLNNRVDQDRYSPDWWSPPLKDYDNLAADGQFIAAQHKGWIVSVFENGVVYIKIFEYGDP